MLFRRKLELDMGELRPELNILRTACLQLRNSQKFKRVLNVSLREHVSGLCGQR